MFTLSQLIPQLDAEIKKLQHARQAIASIADAPAPTQRTHKHHTMSAEGRAKISAAQKARWAAKKKK